MAANPPMDSDDIRLFRLLPVVSLSEADISTEERSDADISDVGEDLDEDFDEAFSLFSLEDPSSCADVDEDIKGSASGSSFMKTIGVDDVVASSAGDIVDVVSSEKN